MTVVGVGAPGTGSAPGPRAQLGFPPVLHTVLGGGADPHRHMVQECYTQARPKPQTVEVEAVSDQAAWGHPPTWRAECGWREPVPIPPRRPSPRGAAAVAGSEWPAFSGRALCLGDPSRSRGDWAGGRLCSGP